MSNTPYKSDCSGFRDVRNIQRVPARSLSYEEQLFVAIEQRDARKVKHLLVKGVNVNAAHPTGRTPLGFAAHVGNVEILKMLLEPLEKYTSNDCLKYSGKKHGKTVIESEAGGTASYKEKRSTGVPTDGRMKQCNTTYGTQGSKHFSKFSLRKDGVNGEDETLQEASAKFQFTETCSEETNELIKIDSSENIQHDMDQDICLQLSSRDLQHQTCSFSVSVDNGEIDGDKVETNQGYFIVVHNEYSPEEKKIGNESDKFSCDDNFTEAVTPDGMDNLEWENELQLEVCHSPEDDTEISDSWVDLYRWYADYLAESCGIDRSLQQGTSLHIDVNQLDMYRRSAMHYAAETGNMEVLRVLFSAGGSVDIGDSDDVTPLHLAAARDYPEAVALLISCGAKVNRKSIDGTGPLHMAAARGFIETARILLEHGACVNALDRNDRTPLHLAVIRGLQEMVKLLTSHGAKVNVEDILGYTPLCQAVWQQEKEIVKLLIAAGAKLTHSDRLLHCSILHRCPAIAELLISAGSIVNLRDDSGDTPLLLAARSGQSDMVKVLLQNGAMASYPNGLTGSTPLHEAVECLRPAQFAEFKEILLTLLSYSGSTGLLNVESSSMFDIPLVRAFVHDRDHAMILLIQYGGDVNILQKHTPIVSEEYLLKRPNRWVIAHLMVFAGLKLWDCTEGIKYGVKYPEESPASWISSMKFNPLSLCALSRLKYRKHHGENLYHAINRSGLPKKLIKYVMMEDIVNVDNYLNVNK